MSNNNRIRISNNDNNNNEITISAGISGGEINVSSRPKKSANSYSGANNNSVGVTNNNVRYYEELAEKYASDAQRSASDCANYLSESQRTLADCEAVKTELEEDFSSGLTDHVENVDNPHNVTAYQVNAYTKSETDILLSGKQPAGNYLTEHQPLDNYYTKAQCDNKYLTEHQDISGKVNRSELSSVAITGRYSDLSGTPSLSEVATSGSYNDLTDKPTIPAAQVQSDWNQSDNTAVDYIKNKPTIPSGVIVDQTYDGTSTNAQSGVAIEGELANYLNYYYTKETFIQPTLSANGTIGGDSFAVGGSPTNVYKAFDNDTSTYFSFITGGIQNVIVIYNPVPIKISDISFLYDADPRVSSILSFGLTIEGSNKSSSNYSFLTYSDTYYSGNSQKLKNFETTEYYKYFRITWNIYSATTISKLYSCTFNGETKTTNTNLTSDKVEYALGYTPYDNSNPNGYITSSAISGKENTSNKITSIGSSSTDTQYPSAKCVYDLLKAIYPVGSVYLSTNSTCPLSALFGTWELVSSDRALWTGDGTNGNTTIAAGLPNITGQLTAIASGNSSSASGCFTHTDTGNCTLGSSGGSDYRRINLNASNVSSIYSDDVTTVQPPAYVVNVWRRTA